MAAQKGVTLFSVQEGGLAPNSSAVGVEGGACWWPPAIWKQEMVPRAKDHEQCQIKVHRKGLAERDLEANKCECYARFINSVSSPGGEGEMKWG